MQVVHRAKTLADAQNARDILDACGIPSHVGDEALWETGWSPGSELIRVMVDNRSLDAARRALADFHRRAQQAPLGS